MTQQSPLPNSKILLLPQQETLYTFSSCSLFSPISDPWEPPICILSSLDYLFYFCSIFKSILFVLTLKLLLISLPFMVLYMQVILLELCIFCSNKASRNLLNVGLMGNKLFESLYEDIFLSNLRGARMVLNLLAL